METQKEANKDKVQNVIWTLDKLGEVTTALMEYVEQTVEEVEDLPEDIQDLLITGKQLVHVVEDVVSSV